MMESGDEVVVDAAILHIHMVWVDERVLYIGVAVDDVGHQSDSAACALEVAVGEEPALDDVDEVWVKWVVVEESLLGIGVCGVCAAGDLGVCDGGFPAGGFVAVREQALAEDGGQVVFAGRRHVVCLPRHGGSDAVHDAMQFHGGGTLEGVVILFRRGHYQRGAGTGGDGVRQGADGLLDVRSGQAAPHGTGHPFHQLVDQYEHWLISEYVPKALPAGVGQLLVVHSEIFERLRAAYVVGDEAGERLGAEAGFVQPRSSGKVAVLAVEADDLHVVRGQIGRYQTVGLALANDVRVLRAGCQGYQGVRLATAVDGCEAVDAGRAARAAVVEAVEDHSAGVFHGLRGVCCGEELGGAFGRGDLAGHRLVQVGGVVFCLSHIPARRAGVQYGREGHRSRYPPAAANDTVILWHVNPRVNGSYCP